MPKRGRDAERQSDRLGVQYMYRVGYDPRKMSDFFQVFQTLGEDSGQQIPGWLSSHPDPPDRIRNTAEQARQVMDAEPRSDLQVNRKAFLDHLEGVVYGPDPREGFTEDGKFYHPDLRFRIDYPDS